MSGRSHSPSLRRSQSSRSRSRSPSPPLLLKRSKSEGDQSPHPFDRVQPRQPSRQPSIEAPPPAPFEIPRLPSSTPPLSRVHSSQSSTHSSASLSREASRPVSRQSSTHSPAPPELQSRQSYIQADIPKIPEIPYTNTEASISDTSCKSYHTALTEQAFKYFCLAKYYHSENELEGALINFLLALNNLYNVQSYFSGPEAIQYKGFIVEAKEAAEQAKTTSKEKPLLIDQKSVGCITKDIEEDINKAIEKTLSYIIPLQDQLRRVKNNRDSSVSKDDKNVQCKDIKTDVITGDVLTFDDISGQETAKENIKAGILYPLLFPRLYPTLSKGILFYGPPGTGKTLLAKAFVNELQKEILTRQIDIRILFYAPTGAELKGKYVGETEKKISNYFQCASKAATDCTIKLTENNRSKGTDKLLSKVISVIFIDEIDSIARSRSKDESGLGANSVNALLQEMDGVKSNSNVIVMAATNYPWLLDEAVLRRFDTKIYLTLPSAIDIEDQIKSDIANRYLKTALRKSEKIVSASKLKKEKEDEAKKKLPGAKQESACKKAEDKNDQLKGKNIDCADETACLTPYIGGTKKLHPSKIFNIFRNLYFPEFTDQKIRLLSQQLEKDHYSGGDVRNICTFVYKKMGARAHKMNRFEEYQEILNPDKLFIEDEKALLELKKGSFPSTKNLPVVKNACNNNSFRFKVFSDTGVSGVSQFNYSELPSFVFLQQTGTSPVSEKTKVQNIVNQPQPAQEEQEEAEEQEAEDEHEEQVNATVPVAPASITSVQEPVALAPAPRPVPEYTKEIPNITGVIKRRGAASTQQHAGSIEGLPTYNTDTFIQSIKDELKKDKIEVSLNTPGYEAFVKMDLFLQEITMFVDLYVLKNPSGLSHIEQQLKAKILIAEESIAAHTPKHSFYYVDETPYNQEIGELNKELNKEVEQLQLLLVELNKDPTNFYKNQVKTMLHSIHRNIMDLYDGIKNPSQKEIYLSLKDILSIGDIFNFKTANINQIRILICQELDFGISIPVQKQIWVCIPLRDQLIQTIFSSTSLKFRQAWTVAKQAGQSLLSSFMNIGSFLSDLWNGVVTDEQFNTSTPVTYKGFYELKQVEDIQRLTMIYNQTSHIFCIEENEEGNKKKISDFIVTPKILTGNFFESFMFCLARGIVYKKETKCSKLISAVNNYRQLIKENKIKIDQHNDTFTFNKIMKHGGFSSKTIHGVEPPSNMIKSQLLPNFRKATIGGVVYDHMYLISDMNPEKKEKLIIDVIDSIFTRGTEANPKHPDTVPTVDRLDQRSIKETYMVFNLFDFINRELTDPRKKGKIVKLYREKKDIDISVTVENPSKSVLEEPSVSSSLSKEAALEDVPDGQYYFVTPKDGAFHPLYTFLYPSFEIIPVTSPMNLRAVMYRIEPDEAMKQQQLDKTAIQDSNTGCIGEEDIEENRLINLSFMESDFVAATNSQNTDSVQAAVEEIRLQQLLAFSKHQDIPKDDKS